MICFERLTINITWNEERIMNLYACEERIIKLYACEERIIKLYACEIFGLISLVIVDFSDTY